MNAVTAILNIIADALGIARKQQDLKNDPKVQKAKMAQNKVDERNRIEKSVAQGDDESAVRDLAE